MKGYAIPYIVFGLMSITGLSNLYLGGLWKNDMTATLGAILAIVGLVIFGVVARDHYKSG